MELIAQEKTEDFRLEARTLEWALRTVGTFFGSVAMSAEQAKGLNKLVKKVKLPLADEDTTDTRPIEQVIEEGALVENVTTEQPSYEQLTAALGGLGPAL